MDFSRVLLCALAIGLVSRGTVDAQDSPRFSGSIAPHASVVIEMENQAATEPARLPTKPNFESASMAADRRAVEAIQRKLQETIITKVDFRDVTVREALAFLNRETGVPIVDLSGALPQEQPLETAEARITLSLKNVSAGEVLRYVTALVGIVSRVEPGAVVLKPLMTTSVQMLHSEEFHVPLAAFGKITTRETAKEFFESKGGIFPPGSTLDYDPSKECLTVRGTEENLVLIEDILEELLAQPGVKQKTKEDRELTRELRQTQEWKETLEKRVVRRVEIHDATMEEIVRELRLKVSPWVGVQADPKVRIRLSTKNIPLKELLRQIADLTKMQTVIGLRAIVFVPAAAVIK